MSAGALCCSLCVWFQSLCRMNPLDKTNVSESPHKSKQILWLKGDGCQYDSFNLSLHHFVPSSLLHPSFLSSSSWWYSPPLHISALAFYCPFYFSLTFCLSHSTSSIPAIFLLPFPSSSLSPPPALPSSSTLSFFCRMVDSKLETVFRAAIIVAAERAREKSKYRKVMKREREREDDGESIHLSLTANQQVYIILKPVHLKTQMYLVWIK